MPLYLDHHKNVEGLTQEAIHEAHMKDLQAQQKHGVNYIVGTEKLLPGRCREGSTGWTRGEQRYHSNRQHRP
jgi:hypothetical protein